VGVVADVKTNGLQFPTPDETYYPFRQLSRGTAAIVARTAKDPALLATVFQAAVSEVDPNEPISGFASMNRRFAGTLGTERVMSGVTAVFAGLAIFLSAVGLYAVLAHSVAARSTEIGIRMAIGARRESVIKMVLSQGMRLVVIGIVGGLVAAASGARALASLLYQVDPHDPWVYLVVGAVFATVGVAASVAPAVRASRVDPVICLRG
jgi:ABC-type antimicrobial peptide transport system permease subunit